MNSRNYWIVLHKDLSHPIGGVKQIHRFAEQMNSLGVCTKVIQEEKDFHPGWFTSNVLTISKKDFFSKKLSPEKDVIILPETAITLLKRYQPKIPKIIFNQNAFYTFGANSIIHPAKLILQLYNDRSVAHILCVSKSNYDLLTGAFGINPEHVSHIINSIEIDLFKPAALKRKQIAFMPRKNRDHAEIVIGCLKRKEWFSDWCCIPLEDLSHKEVAKVLSESLGFFSFGHPEGFGLPLAEAAACGCEVIGYSGIGGREIFQLISDNNKNYEVPYGDWQGFIDSAEHFVRRCNADLKKVKKDLRLASNSIRQEYSPIKMNASIVKAIKAWDLNLPKD